MLAMSDINCIKHLRNNKGLSITKIQQTLKINWRTAKKYADEDQIPSTKISPKKGMMYEEEWGEIVSDWLFEDSKLRRKDRRSKKKLFEELQGLGFKGSYRTLCYYIEEWKNTHNNEKDKGYERLEHPPGEAQVDFGVMEAVQDGELVDIRLLIMSYPNSNAGFAVPLPAENQECFLHGLQLLFKQAGGVPMKVRIDNLSPAIKRVRTKTEEAQLTDEFLAFQNYYGFEVQACNPRSGHEKGNVENKVGYIRYNFFNKAPIMTSFEDLTVQLEKQLIEDRNRLHYEKNVFINELWEHEKKSLLQLPKGDFPIIKKEMGKVNKYNELKLDQALVHVPRASNYSLLHVLLTWNTVKVISPDGEILLDDYRPYMKKRKALPWISIFKTWINKPRAVSYSRYKDYLPGRVKNYLLVDHLVIRRERLKAVASLLLTHDMKRINEQFYELVSEERLGKEENPFEINWSDYDSLTKSEEVHT
jgi:transposase